MSARRTAAPAIKLWNQHIPLIDTHCHAHVSLGGTPAAATAAAAATTATANCCNTSDSTSRADHDQLRDVVAEHDDQHSHEKTDQAQVIAPPRRVVHVTMGIDEQDWARAVTFGCSCADGLIVERSGHTSLRGQQQVQLLLDKKPRQEGEGFEGAVAASPTPFFIFGVGLHPWKAHARSEGWLRDLTALLEAHPRAVVGEIGLDKFARTPDTRRVEWDHQLEVFHAQMALAARLCRPTSVHCVKAHGKIVDFLRGTEESGNPQEGRKRGGARVKAGCGGFRKTEQAGGEGGEGRSRRLPPRMALHSFTGSVEVARDILRLGGDDRECEVYFGFSAAVNMRGDRETKRFLEVVRVIPDSQVLIETDRDAVPMADAGDELLRVCGGIAEAKGISVEEAVSLANRNALRFLEATN